MPVVGGRLDSTSFTFDDTQSQMLTGLTSEILQNVLEEVDRRQDKDDLTNFRDENVISEISSVSGATPDGWHLLINDTNAEHNNLVLVASGATTERETPKVNDRIIIDGTTKQFDGNEWSDVATGSAYFIDPVNGVIETPSDLPGTVVNGDRYLIKTPPSIQFGKDGAWKNQEFIAGSTEFPDGATVVELNSDRLWKRQGANFIYYLPPTEVEYFEWGLFQDLPLSDVTPDGLIYPLPLDKLVFPALLGEVDLTNGWYVPSKSIASHIDISLDFKEHIIEPVPYIALFWRRTNDNGSTWENALVVLETKGKDGFFARSHNIDFEIGYSYQPCLEFSVAPTIEDILLADNTLISSGAKNSATIQAIANLDEPLRPVVSNFTTSNQNANLIDLQYQVSILPESKNLQSLQVSLFANNVLVEAQPAVGSGINAGDSVTFNFVGIDMFLTGNLNDFSLEVDYA